MRTVFQLSLLAAISLLLFVGNTRADEPTYIWLEGEKPTESNLPADTGGWGNVQYLSGEDWLHFGIAKEEVEATSPEGLLYQYDFNVDEPGDYEIWGRLGHEFIRSTMEWRIDDGEWTRVEARDPEYLSIDLMEIARWCEIAWIDLGDENLSQGAHTLEIRFPLEYEDPETRARPKRLIGEIDAFCLSKGKFVPNGPHKPDDDWMTEEDRKAAEPVTFFGYSNPLFNRPWQIARYDEKGLVEDRTGPIPYPEDIDSLHWSAIQVPGDKNSLRPDLTYCHRYLYRVNVDIPADWAEKSFLLHFGRTSMIVSVYVNGQEVGFHDIPGTRFKCDCTKAIKPGEVNEIVVGVKDAYYAMTGEGDQNARYGFNYPIGDMNTNQGMTMRFDFPMKGALESGLLESVGLATCDGAIIDDIYVIPNVEEMRLDLEITVTNLTNQEQEFRIENAITEIKKPYSYGGGLFWYSGEPGPGLFIPGMVVGGPGAVAGRLAPHETKVVRLSSPFENAKLWWPDDPVLYELGTTLSVGGGPCTEAYTNFGFRQWGIDGHRFTLNGVPWQFRANLDHYGLDGDADWQKAANQQFGQLFPKEAREAVEHWRKTGQNMFRHRFQKQWGGMNEREMLDFFDYAGVPVRRNVGTFDGQHASYRLAEYVEVDGERVKVPNKALLENWRRQAERRVIEERNHPCIFVWELDNEIIYINARNFGNLDAAEPEFKKTAEAVMALDKQGRSVVTGGGRALMDGSLPVNGCHYEESDLRDYPDMAYGLGPVGEAKAWTDQSDKQPWPMQLDKPIFLSETYYSPGWMPSRFAAVGGEQCFLGRADTRDANGLIARMFSEGYRWQELGAFHYWFGNYGDEHYKAWQPVCPLCREWNWTFSHHDRVKRTIMVRNDTRFDTPITLAWELAFGDDIIDQGEHTLSIPPGEGEIQEITMEMPHDIDGRIEGVFQMRCLRDGEVVWSDEKAVSVLGRHDVHAPDFQSHELAIIGGEGNVGDWIFDASTTHDWFQDVESFFWRAEEIAFDVVVVERNVLTPAQATDPRWMQIAASGTRIIMLEQEHPLHFQAVPADLEVTDYVGRVAFAENLEHPIFRSLKQKDFFTWSGDHIVYRNAYRKATRGARSLVQCDEELSCSAMVECPVGDGLLLLCQMVVDEKLKRDPVAGRLFVNMLDYAKNYKLVQNRTAVCMAENDLRRQLLDESGLEYQAFDDPVHAIASGEADIVIVDATPANLQSLLQAKQQVAAFQQQGGWIILWGVNPNELETFNALAGTDHVMRPFRCEKVQIPGKRDPLMTGLSQRDVVFYNGEKIFGWKKDEYLADDAFTHIVDLDEIAPFCTGDGIGMGKSSVVNGMTSADGWKYIYYMEGLEDVEAKMRLKLPRAETITGFSIIPNEHYKRIEKFKLVFDGDASKTVQLELDDREGRQDFTFDEPIRAASLALVPLTYTIVKDRPVTGVDNIWIHVEREEQFDEGVRPLLSIGGLVKYPRGEGGLLLNQLNIIEHEANEENASKKKLIVATLLRNLNATFGGGEAIDGAFGYTPVSLENCCNLYLTNDRGWPDKGQDLSRLPLGDQKFAGVNYLIRDFETSPLESAVTLQGMPGVRDLERAVTGIAVEAKADALLFLHTYYQKSPWRPRLRDGKPTEAPPVVFEYVVHYADGETAVVPVQLGLGATHWLTENAAGLRDAALAWTVPMADKQHAVVHSLEWKNPRPDVAIDSVDLQYNERVGNRYGSPVLLAITAGRSVE